FVAFKQYLTAQEFAYGYAAVQALPGPVFSFAAYLGGMSMREFGTVGIVAGGIIAAIAINLPGMLLIFFTLNFWQSLKQYRPIRASLEGINASGAGLVVSAAYLLFVPLKVDFMHLQTVDFVNFGVIITTFICLHFTKIPHPLVVLLWILLGLVF
ncbi:MAG: chromate transporter, partial [Thermoflexibacteraceae bacterium]